MAGEEDELTRSIDSILDGHISADPLMDKQEPGDAPKEKPDKAVKPKAAPKVADPDEGDNDTDDGEDDEPPAGAKPDSTKEKDAPAVTQAEVKGIITERKKRQAAEAKAERLQQELETAKGGGAKATLPQRPNPTADPEGARQYDEWVAEERRWDDRVSLSRSFMQEVKSDYDEKEAAFLEAAEGNPGMALALRRSPNPAKHAYEEGRKIIAQREIGDDPEAYKQKLRDQLKDEVKAEIMAELGIEKPAGGPVAKQKPAIPPSLANVSAAAPRDANKAWDGPPPLDSIITGPG